MTRFLSGLFLASALALVQSLSPAAAQPRIVLEPNAIELELGNGLEVWETAINVSNEGNEDLIWNSGINIIAEPGGQQNWLRAEPMQGQVPPGDGQDVIVAIGHQGLSAGMYDAELRFNSNDPDNPEVLTVISMDCNGEWQLVARWNEDWGYPQIIDWNRAFDRMALGQAYSLPIVLLNNGGEPIRIIEISSDNHRFTANPHDRFIIQPFNQAQVNIAVQVQAESMQEGLLTISSDLQGDLRPIPLRALIPWQRGFEVSLAAGWNLISAPIEPLNQDIRVVFSILREPDALQAVKGAFGRFYLPAFNFNNIDSWDFRYGYLVKVSRETILPFNGGPAPADTPIPLYRGWNIVSYLPETERDQFEAFFNITRELIIVKDGQGRFYWPEQDFNNMPLMNQGTGYQVKVSRGVVLVWNE
ncbi:MAG: hypothetical protein V2A61_05590 [Calditrichota bacterium]